MAPENTMYRVAAVLLVLVAGSLAVTVAQAKGPPSKVVISGGGLGSEVAIPESDLGDLAQSGYYSDSGGVPYANGLTVQGETPYHVSVYTDEGSGEPWEMISASYYPWNSDHPALLSDGTGLWQASPVFANLLDSHIAAAQVDGGVSAGWFVFGAFVAASAAVFAAVHSLRSRARRRHFAPAP
ncbi:MAG TPA: hypothetical protein VMT90_04660 [Dehalococcoidia bacterium]|jgi:hypothetical protein|nr:hypothetical protein [Dehalococcoidia bacterium]